MVDDKVNRHEWLLIGEVAALAALGLAVIKQAVKVLTGYTGQETEFE